MFLLIFPFGIVGRPPYGVVGQATAYYYGSLAESWALRQLAVGVGMLRPCLVARMVLGMAFGAFFIFCPAPSSAYERKGARGGGRWVVMAAPCSEAMLSLVASAGRLGRNKVCVCVSISSAPKAGDLSQVTIFIGAVEDIPHTLFVENTARNSNACNQQGV